MFTIESNMVIYKDNKEIILTISAQKISHGSGLDNIIAYTNSGQQYHLTAHEEMKAYHILINER